MGRASGAAGRRQGPGWKRLAGRAVLLAALAAAGSCCATLAVRASATTPSPTVADVTLTGHGPAIPRSFFGLSIEYTELGDYMQLGPVFDNVISLLRAGDGSPMVLRLGGRSSDEVVWTPPASGQVPGSPGQQPGTGPGSGGQQPGSGATGQPPAALTPRLGGGPPWVHVLSQQWLTDLAELARRESLRVELELNLVAHSPSMAVSFVQAARAALPPRALAGVAIGNEPDLYRKQPGIDDERITSTIASTPARWAAHYTAADYRRDYVAYARALRGAFPRIPLSAPDITHPSMLWPSELFGLGGLSPQSISLHRYATATCKTGQVKVPSPQSFLDDRYTAGLAGTVAQDVALVHAHHLALRVTEMNSFTCGGRKQIAESFATALWAPDALFEMLRTRVNGVSWHIRPELPNAPFHITPHGIAALPELYGLALFEQMLGPRPVLEHLEVRHMSPPGLKVWAVDTAVGMRVLALDKGSSPVTVDIRDPGASGSGTLARLLAPALADEGGVTLAGQWIGADGRWHGHRVITVVPQQGGAYQFSLAPYTGAILSLPQG